MSNTNLTGNEVKPIDITCMSLQQRVAERDGKTEKWVDDERDGKLTVLHKVQGQIPPEEVFSQTSTEVYILGEDGKRRTVDGKVIGETSLSAEELRAEHERDRKFKEVIAARNNQKHGDEEVEI